MNPTAGGTPPPQVAIVGAGPVGLALALGLARHGVRSALVERRSTTNEHSRAPVIHVRTREVLRQWGVERRFLDAGVLRRTLALHAHGRERPLLSIDFAELEPEARDPGMLLLEQAHTERLLLDAVRETGLCTLHFGTDAVGLHQDENGVELTLRRDGELRTLRVPFAAGCDGAGSFVRRALGLPFDGITYGLRPMLADVRIDDPRDTLPWPRIRNGRGGITAGIRLSAGLWRLIHLERHAPDADDDVPREEVRTRMRAVLGDGPFDVVWASRFRIHRRSAPRFRVGGVLLAGDAAHVHSPVGGLGMNGGIQDAHNLAWKLATALRGGDAERLLDSYDVERRAAIVERVSRSTDRQTSLFLDSPAAFRTAAFAFFRLLLAVPPLRRANLRRTAMLDLDYPASPLLDGDARAAGVRLPDPLLTSASGDRVRLYDLLPCAPALLELGDVRRPDLPVDRVIRIGAGGYADPSGTLRRLLGATDGWILVRPDAHVAWARHRADGMAAAVHRALGTQG